MLLKAVLEGVRNFGEHGNAPIAALPILSPAAIKRIMTMSLPRYDERIFVEFLYSLSFNPNQIAHL